MGFHFFPIQFYPVARAVGGDGLAVFDLKRVGQILFESKPMPFQVGSVRHCGERVNMEVVKFRYCL
jgi:hypothetical protein